MNKNKKICFIGGGLSGGGQERALTNYANEFAKNGYEVIIVCLFKTEVFYKIHDNIRIIWPEINRNDFSKFIYAIKLIPFIRKVIKEVGADVVISFGDWYNSYVIIATRLLNLKVFITNRMGPAKGYGLILNFFNKITYPLANGMIVQTERARELILNRFKVKNITVIENILNPIDIDRIMPKNNIISIGRLSKEKGHKILLEAFSKIRDVNNWNLIIIGDGPEFDSLNELSKVLGIEKNVNFLGHLKDFKYHLSLASIYVLPSFFEGFPNSLLEAMSVPLACISSDCIAGPREIINHKKNGLLFKPGDANDLTFYLNLLIEDKNLRDKIKTEAYKVRLKYTLENSYKKFEHFVIYE